MILVVSVGVGKATSRRGNRMSKEKRGLGFRSLGLGDRDTEEMVVRDMAGKID